MNNSKKNIHNSGPLGKLIGSGHVKKVDTDEELNSQRDYIKRGNEGSFYFKTQFGIEFNENELIFVDPKECEPWKYANRLEDDMGDLEGLIESIRENKQLQPALVRPHPNRHDGIIYEIIFGRRRHLACLKLGIPFLVIRKNIQNIQDAVASQDAENKFRKNVSGYSNALFYKRLLAESVFKTEKELAKKLGMSSSTLNDLMAYIRIPDDIIKAMPNIHNLSNSMALKIVSLLNKSDKWHNRILECAPEIGKTITSPIRLEKALSQKKTRESYSNETQIVFSPKGKKLFTFKRDQRGAPCFVLHRELWGIDHEQLCDYLKSYLEAAMKSGYPDQQLTA
jgi:ParB family transcriptional regulator, chromosome partitioning protein